MQVSIATVGLDRAISIWDVRKQGDVPALRIENAHKSEVTAVAWHPSTAVNAIASGGLDSMVQVCVCVCVHARVCARMFRYRHHPPCHIITIIGGIIAIVTTQNQTDRFVKRCLVPYDKIRCVFQGGCSHKSAPYGVKKTSKQNYPHTLHVLLPALCRFGSRGGPAIISPKPSSLFSQTNCTHTLIHAHIEQ